MPLDQNLYQTVTRFACVGFSMYACDFLYLKFDNNACLHARQDQNMIWKYDFFFAKIGIFCKSIAGKLAKLIHNHIR